MCVCEIDRVFFSLFEMSASSTIATRCIEEATINWINWTLKIELNKYHTIIGEDNQPYVVNMSKFPLCLVHDDLLWNFISTKHWYQCWQWQRKNSNSSVSGLLFTRMGLFVYELRHLLIGHITMAVTIQTKNENKCNCKRTCWSIEFSQIQKKEEEDENDRKTNMIAN